MTFGGDTSPAKDLSSGHDKLHSSHFTCLSSPRHHNIALWFSKLLPRALFILFILVSHEIQKRMKHCIPVTTNSTTGTIIVRVSAVKIFFSDISVVHYASFTFSAEK